MAAHVEHVLERRSRLLASKIKHRITVLAEVMKPPGGHVPFTEQLTNEQALGFWRKNRYTDVGKKILAGWTPTQVIQLDNWLAKNPAPDLQAEPLVPFTMGLL